MIPRLDVAVDRKRRARPVWRADLCAQHAAPELLTSGFEALDRYWQRRLAFALKEPLPDKLRAQNRFARLGTHRLQRRLRLAVRTAQTEVVGPAKAALHVPRCRLPYDLEQILR